MVAAAFWATVLTATPQAAVWQADVRQVVAEAEARRRWADYNTGSILEAEAYALRALAEYVRAHTVIEVGTFIGTSTCALASASTVTAVYTCDASNDCLVSSGIIRTFPKASSTVMLRHLVAQGVRADLCFFDGTLGKADIPLIAAATTASPVFAVHDYNYGPKLRMKGGRSYCETVPRKGIGNGDLLRARWPRHVVVEPLPETTLAVLVPEATL